MIEIYTDGSSRGNPGKGGFGVIIMEDNKILDAFGAQEDNVTNNQMELKAIFTAIKYIKEKQQPSIIYSDSAYCIGICTSWIFSWERNNWTRSGGKEVLNLDIIKEIYNLLISGYNNFEFKKVRGHDNCIGNELADAVATANKAKFEKIFFENGLIIEK